MRFGLLSLTLAALLFAPTAQAAMPKTCSCLPARSIIVKPHKRPKGTVLLIHGGAWVWGDSSVMLPTAKMYARRGYRAVSVGYPLRDMAAAYRTVERIARHYHRRAYAIGFSAGGSMSAWLAAKRLVRSAVSLSGPGNLDLALGGEPKPMDLWKTTNVGRWSPLRLYNRHSSPLRVVGGDKDPYMQGQLREYHQQGASIRLVHGLSHETRAWELPYALKFVRRHSNSVSAK